MPGRRGVNQSGNVEAPRNFQANLIIETGVEIDQQLFIASLNELAAARNVIVDVDTAAKDWLAEKGYDPQYGARPLKRLITDTISQPLSKRMLFGDLKNGGRATVTVVDGKLDVQAGA